MPIVWRNQMSVGNDAIDQDHKLLFCLINSIELALRSEDAMELLPVFIQQLLAYTKEHFAREEEIQKKIYYPLIDEHKREHKEIVVKLVDMERLVAEYISKEQRAQLGKDEQASMRKEIIDLARHWIMDHVLQRDKSMEIYLRKLPRTFR